MVKLLDLLSMKNSYKEGKYVYKKGGNLKTTWRKQFREIIKVIKIPAFYKFLSNGYITHFIDGIDLQEDKPFNYRHDIVRAYPLNEKQKKAVIRIFKDIVYAGIKTGYTLADFTKRNLIVRGDDVFLIDYDVIIQGDLNEDYIKIFQNMLDYLEIDYRFNGDLKELEVMLR